MADDIRRDRIERLLRELDGIASEEAAVDDPVVSHVQRQPSLEDSYAMDKTVTETVVDNIRALAKAKGDRSVTRVLVDAGVNRAFLSNVKDPRHGLSVTHLAKIADELGEPIVSLFEPADKREERRRLQRIAGKMTPAQLRLLESHGRAILQESPRPNEPED